ncbi:MAG TPA: 3-deoxy-8-phosphooctulonate synthase [Armatimonadota bacterium]|jgi:2-dehydro-3-deoxyphosphooctonate aldolase (KDO 8-P synthase)
MQTHSVKAGAVTFGGAEPLALIAGPCVAESLDLCRRIANHLSDLCSRLSLPLVFKASFDKANRTSVSSFRGPGLQEGLSILSRVAAEFRLPICTDVHEVGQVAAAAQVADILQIPAFLCRQTDLVIAAAETGKAVNVKKGQFLAPWDMRNVVGKVTSTGSQSLLLTERGATFGYGNLVVDFRGLAIMRELGFPVVYDGTHSLQLPGGAGDSTAGQRQYAPHLLRAACAVGVDGLFLEVHPEPEKGLSDSTTMLPLSDLERILRPALQMDQVLRATEGSSQQ